MKQRRNQDDLSWAAAVLWAAAIAIAMGLLISVLLGAEELPTPAIYRYGRPHEARISEQLWCAEYDGQTRLPRWTLEVITAESLAGTDVRVDCFRADNRCPPECRAALADYAKSGYDRGHLVPAGDFGRAEDQARTFTLANIAPQSPALNRGLWRELEGYIRTFAMPGHPVWVVTCPLFLPHDGRVSYPVIGPNQVAVPTHFGKSMLLGGDRPVVSTWIVPNAEPKPTAEPKDYLTSVDELERAAGLDLWAGLEDDLEKALEAGK